MKIVLASRNKNKIREMQTLLRELCDKYIIVLSLDDIGFTDEIIENGNSFSENALKKARAPKSEYIVVADDSGLCVDVLDGAPGIYSARYSSLNATDAENNAKLLAELESYSPEEKTAHFTSAIACVFPDQRMPLVVEDTCDGLILDAPRGNDGFGYDPLFYVPELSKTFAQLTQDEKNRISHRGKAMRAFASAFAELIKP